MPPLPKTVNTDDLLERIRRAQAAAPDEPEPDEPEPDEPEPDETRPHRRSATKPSPTTRTATTPITFPQETSPGSARRVGGFVWKPGRVLVVSVTPPDANGKGGRESYDRVPGLVCGPLGVRQTGRAWHVVSNTLGLRVAELKDDGAALEVAAVLLKTAGSALSHDVWEDVIKALPRWVRPWVKAVNKARAFVDPTPFQAKK